MRPGTNSTANTGHGAGDTNHPEEACEEIVAIDGLEELAGILLDQFKFATATEVFAACPS